MFLFKVFDLIPGALWAAALAAAVATAGWFALGASQAQVQAERARAEVSAIKRQVAEQIVEATAAARKREQTLVKANERIANDAQARIDLLQNRIADLQRATGGLRDTIDALNSRAAPTDSTAASYAAEASTARELLGECSVRYSGVAAQADLLRDQVTGLQDYAKNVCTTPGE